MKNADEMNTNGLILILTTGHTRTWSLHLKQSRWSASDPLTKSATQTITLLINKMRHLMLAEQIVRVDI